MRLAYQYRLRLTTEQKARINHWLDLLRRHYNYLLGDRFDWWERNRCPVNACSVLVSHLRSLREQPEYYGQKRDLVRLKQLFPEYKDIHADVLQEMVKRVKLAFDRYIKGDCNGNRSGKPRFKGKGRYRTFSYPRVKTDCIQNGYIQLPKLGKIKLIDHRPIPEGFTIKTALVTKKADGFYVTLSLVDHTVPDFNPDHIEATEDNSIGIDLGLEKFGSLSTGEVISIPQYFRKAEDKLEKLQQKASTRKKGSRARKLLYRKVAKLHQRIQRQRKQFHFEQANQLTAKSDVIFIEDLKIHNMTKRCKPKQDETGKYLPNGQAAKSGLNKSFADAGLGQFIEILSFKAENAGVKVVKVNPRNTSQFCSTCLNIVPKGLSERWHSCPYCLTELDRDLNSAILIKKVGLGAKLTIKRSRKYPREATPIALA
ncbi:transposase [Limnoraphis robusta Tam1]|uniref:Transposase n=1 Tax=Limnoraphis robusta CCNP1315 TaxID=3110306 RepID=A0ABU5TY39_9CYAN|nr:transposase [Limnoraphis robusta]MEA5496306.1 transposase [Limnoraphis robusta BA-68 BA1]MEA5519800.1 transposase [Limnoraphis robusta CCNP1315]MEA5540993.1 transposase [Limnoraphis robusta Tam1]MEA5548159.1 transposase [Limnoraphis robusta CCNP1324]